MRLSDVVIVNDVPQTQILSEPPLIAIEIVSPSDTYSQLNGRMRDLAAMGVKNLWIIDPQQRVDREYWEGAWVEVLTLTVPDSPIYLDVNALFVKLDH